MRRGSISFVHISDTHIGENGRFCFWGNNTLARGKALVEFIRSSGLPIDFAVHTGDVINGAPEKSFALAERLFSSLPFPTFFVQGNHDGDTAEFKQFASRTKKPLTFIDETSSSYFFTAKGLSFLALDCRGPEAEDPHGLFTRRHETIVTRFLGEAKQAPVVIFIHFPVLPLDSRWIDRDMLLRNGGRLHALLRTSGGKGARCVFFGHIHHRTSFIRDGILYSSAPSPSCQFSIAPADNEPRFEPAIPVSFNYVTLTPSTVIVKEMTPAAGKR